VLVLLWTQRAPSLCGTGVAMRSGPSCPCPPCRFAAKKAAAKEREKAAKAVKKAEAEERRKAAHAVLTDEQKEALMRERQVQSRGLCTTETRCQSTA
jgi:hypothetical protein